MTGPPSRSAGTGTHDPKGGDLAVLPRRQELFFSLALLLPLLMHPLWTVLLFYVTASLVQGLMHQHHVSVGTLCGGGCFSPAQAGHRRNRKGLGRTPGRNDRRFRPARIARSPGSLAAEFPDRAPPFPRICHVNYPALAPLVEETCREFGLRYAAHETFRAGIASHFRWLRRMGRSST